METVSAAGCEDSSVIKESESVNHLVAPYNLFPSWTSRGKFIYKHKLNSLVELKKVFCRRAFSGELSSPEWALSVNDGIAHRPGRQKP